MKVSMPTMDTNYRRPREEPALEAQARMRTRSIEQDGLRQATPRPLEAPEKPEKPTEKPSAKRSETPGLPPGGILV